MNTRTYCSFTHYIYTLYLHLYAQSNKLVSIFNHCTTYVKLVLFDSYCTSLYCPFLWTDYTKRTFSKLRVAFNNPYRKTFNLPIWSSASTM